MHAKCCAACKLASWSNCAALRAGLKNTNYFLTSTQGEFVLTLFERLTAEQLPFYLHLMKHLAHGGIPVPEPRPTNTAKSLHTVAANRGGGEQAWRGKSQLAPSPCTARPWAPCWRACTWWARLRPPPAQPARPALVERNRARGAAAPGSPPRLRCCSRNWLIKTMWRRRPPMPPAPRPGACRPVPRQRDVCRRHPHRLLRLLLCGRRHLAVRPGRVPERLVH